MKLFSSFPFPLFPFSLFTPPLIYSQSMRLKNFFSALHTGQLSGASPSTV
jgi:hypothetical protein